jgi:GH25 family lysozyme M1 (1,4-beta-N-acetylmuramidase)
MLATLFTIVNVPSAAASYIAYDGKMTMKSGVVYTVKKTVTVTGNMTIPTGAKLLVYDGATLKLSGASKTYDVKGTLSTAAGGTVSLVRGALTIDGGGAVSVYGTMLHYKDALLKIKSGELKVFNAGDFTSSGKVQIYTGGSFLVRNKAVFTKSSDVTVTGSVTSDKGAELSLQGAFGITKAGSVVSNGHLTVGGVGVVKNSGVFTLAKGSTITKFGKIINSKNGSFRDLRTASDKADNSLVEMLAAAPKVVSLGIDVSFYQGNIDWKMVKNSGVRFAILRAGRGTFSDAKPIAEDTTFRQNLEGANAAGMDIGVYFYSYAKSVSEIKQEAKFLVNSLNGIELRYPVVLDVEEDDSSISVSVMTKMVEAFCDIIVDAGYYPMLYSHGTWLNKYLDNNTLNKYPVWLAAIQQNPTYKGTYYMWQYSWKGSVPGITGDVDLNVSYRDFPTLLYNNKFNHIATKPTPITTSDPEPFSEVKYDTSTNIPDAEADSGDGWSSDDDSDDEITMDDTVYE